MIQREEGFGMQSVLLQCCSETNRRLQVVLPRGDVSIKQCQCVYSGVQSGCYVSDPNAIYTLFVGG